MKNGRFGLPAGAIEEIRGVLARNPRIEKAILYGSRAKGNYKNGSDIDLTLRGESLSLRDLLRLMTELDDLLLPYTIDLSLLHLIEHAPLLEHVERVGQDFYDREGSDVPQPAARA